MRIAEQAYLIDSRLEAVARGAGFAGISDLLAAIRAGGDQALVWRLVEAMTASETSFFRDKAVFTALEADVLPRLARARAGGPVRVWSAACSTGQEIYSLAMLAERARLGGGDTHLVLAASDLSASALARAKSGLYSQFEVQRGLPIRLLVRHFEKVGDMWRISPDIRRQVLWRRINLVADLGAVGSFDVILCRNVISGMEPAFQKKVLEALARVLPADGVLALGAGESADAAGGALQPVAGQSGLFRPDPAARAAAA